MLVGFTIPTNPVPSIFAIRHFPPLCTSLAPDPVCRREVGSRMIATVKPSRSSDPPGRITDGTGKQAGAFRHAAALILDSDPAAGPDRPPTLAQDRASRISRASRSASLIGSTAGGGYDVFARTIAAHWGKHIPGNPQFVPQNMPGPLSLNVANHIFTVAPKDGTVLGGVNPQIASEAILDPERARYDARQLLWIGSALREVQVLVARADAPGEVVLGGFTKELIVGGSGGATDTFPTISNADPRHQVQDRLGLSRHQEINLAMERGEVQGVGSITWASIKATMGDCYWPRRRSFCQANTASTGTANCPTCRRVLDFAKSGR